MRYRTILAAAVLALAGTACAGDDAESADSAAGGAPAAEAPSSGDDLTDVSNYRLSMDKVDRYFDAQLAIARRIKDLSPEERAPLEQMESSANATLDDMARRMESHPATREGLREANISAREFSTLTMAMVQAGMAASVLQMRPNDNQDSLAREMKASMENIRFMRENEAEITRKQQELEAQLREMGVYEES
ncbi:MAG TPA: hypothetical protein VFT04_00520 [Gemmatimonadales bacterium]|nr:hypothetical protein [Gemmatimonadales bacterium]